jgi:hypothetical protein
VADLMEIVGIGGYIVSSEANFTPEM